MMANPIRYAQHDLAMAFQLRVKAGQLTSDIWRTPLSFSMKRWMRGQLVRMPYKQRTAFAIEE